MTNYNCALASDPQTHKKTKISPTLNTGNNPFNIENFRPESIPKTVDKLVEPAGLDQNRDHLNTKE